MYFLSRGVYYVHCVHSTGVIKSIVSIVSTSSILIAPKLHQNKINQLMKGDSITKKNTGLFDNNPVFACLCYFNFQNNLLIRVPIRIGVTHRQWVVS